MDLKTLTIHPFLKTYHICSAADVYRHTPDTIHLHGKLVFQLVAKVT